MNFLLSLDSHENLNYIVCMRNICIRTNLSLPFLAVDRSIFGMEANEVKIQRFEHDTS